ncbi:MAG TPA: cytochrome P460 family protein [Candidatus Dormibacteraeota bacterium]|nr:cytochrome P460 family protein [Candidatus Dormibacteraeota bacterium]
MKRAWILMVLSVVALALATMTPQASPSNESGANSPVYTSDGNLKFPAQYREWVYLTSGVDMSYSPNMSMDHSMFDNVFVNPEAYKGFFETGTWPDKTMLVLEARVAGSKASINKNGQFQTGEVMGREVHVKDVTRFPGKWAFFNAEDGVTGKLLPREMDCYSCHEQHGAVDTSFVQFYPTLLEIAKKKNTLSRAYVKEEAGK